MMNRRFVRLALLGVVALFTLTFVLEAVAPVSASAPATVISGTIRVGTARIRANATTRSRTVVKLSSGTTLTVLGANKGHRWLKVQLNDGRVGWVIAFAVKLNGITLKAVPVTQ